MKRLLVLTTVLLIASAGYGIVAPGGTGDYSSGAEVIYAQEQTREVYGSGAIQKWNSEDRWSIIQDDPDTDENCNGSLVLVFQLPDRGGQLLEARSLMFKLGYIYKTRVDRVDLYGIDYFAAEDVADPNQLAQPGMFYIGAWGADPEATALDDGVVVTEDVGSGGTIDTWFANDTEGALRLSCWLNSLYDEGAVAGDYVLLRLNYNEKFSVYTNLNVHNINTTDNVRIYYDLVDNLSDTCPGPVVPEMSCSEDIPGDLNDDCKVGLDDYIAMAVDWLRCDRIPSRLCD